MHCESYPLILIENFPHSSHPQTMVNPASSLWVRPGITSSINRRNNTNKNSPFTLSKSVTLTLVVLVIFWCVCLILITVSTSTSSILTSPASTTKIRGSASKKTEKSNHQSGDGDSGGEVVNEHAVQPRNLSRGNGSSHNIKIKADVVGNLGPIDVVLQAKPGTNWLRDRWQAASDMHGTAIKGDHWIEMDFGEEKREGTSSVSGGPVIVTSIILDWETAYADKYRIEASSTKPISGRRHDDDQDDVWILYDGTDPQQQQTMRTVSEYGQSPGVKEKRPLHVIHTLSLRADNNTQRRPIRYLRLHILKSATGWGVSLWQFDVFGFYVHETVE